VNTTPATPSEDGAAPVRQCWCVINHPVTDEERAELAKAFEYAREVGDAAALPLLLARLTGPCPARS